MAEGELEAAFKGLAEDAAQAGDQMAESLAKFVDKTAEKEEANLARILEVEERNTRALDKLGEPGASAGDEPAAGTPAGGSPEGPPWRVADGTPGAARGKSLNPPNPRHTIAGARRGRVKEENSVILQGYEGAVREDVRQIAAGNAVWNPRTNTYEINGRSYGVEPNGTVFPISGQGIVELDRNEYVALQKIVRAHGDLDQVNEFRFDPRFLNNPQAVTKAKAIYDGTYTP